MFHEELKAHSALACMQHALTDTLKVLLRSSVLMKITIASQGKNNITDASITILDWDNSNNLLHCWKVMSTSIASFN